MGSSEDRGRAKRDALAEAAPQRRVRAATPLTSDVALRLVRAASAALAPLFLQQGLSLSSTGTHHALLIYLSLYGGAIFFGITFAWTWIALERRKDPG
ncbi:MAG TPA: hypothetical protein VF517_11185 [Thermoleophilaceae bacterium]|jgi:hypothetical protein